MIAVQPTFAAVTARKAACCQVAKRSFSFVEMEELSSLRSYLSAVDQTLFLS
ncbi:hypothetical protein [Bradyrhizobium liaoningense]|uniref:hypothetical protein n=1 Tax=Bradyrhizobium liaoningense TaxID=43992 RepID=UPI001BA46CE7|nr:hypothetical protein [Bradyrhizobium liaoningense]MBR0819874.1 hypothetical protein [Bradyrhizobium liaoningense]